MGTTQRILVAVWMAGAAVTWAADARVEILLSAAREVAASGRFEHAVRGVDMALVKYPEDPDLLALRAELIEVVERERGKPVTASATAVRPVMIENRSAEPGRNFTVESNGIAMIWIAPGTFRMSNPQGSDDDTLVTLTRGYWLGRTEVTQEQVQTVMPHLPPQSNFRGSDRPVERISWLSAMEFGRIVTERERAAGRLPPDYEYTLPTEAQWEFACRAGTTGPYAGELESMAWFEANSDGQTHPVAQKRPNAWGLYDMHGNVSEWCLDGFHGYPGGSVADLMIGYDGPSAAMVRMVRGGSCSGSAGQCHAGIRIQYQINYTSSGIGFRLVLAPKRKGVEVAQ
jgi:formylglycine-generating enzyme required for sulfatase activity